ncbi:DUF2975 domain-containing protein [Phytoactinopolyspora halotolerans]|uniref:DUF2975 domain-containing protein n=1 Tax=Phytoactinopolyspora halotolerans TaxID=1981512 RepID=A0A6L9S540_9ACTN|nr:DUF2975 domain-containing protein [Phytoactinopolyspora halotolerans]NEE00103.1 DUF2975 domain-containing protein [Phytoactinopolyspora halotolerans]
MTRLHRTVGLLRILLVVLFAGLVVAQVVVMPETLADMAEEEPDLASLRWPLLVFSIAELLCIQVVIVCTWKLLSMVKADRIFKEEAFGWVNAILWAMSIAWVLLLGMFIYLTVQVEDPGLPVLLFGVVLAAGVLVLLMVVMRALLRQATALRTDMEGVI